MLYYCTSTEVHTCEKAPQKMSNRVCVVPEGSWGGGDEAHENSSALANAPVLLYVKTYASPLPHMPSFLPPFPPAPDRTVSVPFALVLLYCSSSSDQGLGLVMGLPLRPGGLGEVEECMPNTPAFEHTIRHSAPFLPCTSAYLLFAPPPTPTRLAVSTAAGSIGTPHETCRWCCPTSASRSNPLSASKEDTLWLVKQMQKGRKVKLRVPLLVCTPRSARGGIGLDCR